MYIYVLKHNLLGLCNVARVHVFRADHVALENQLQRSPLGKTIVPILRIPSLAVASFVYD